MAALTDAEIAERHASLVGWEIHDGSLHRELRFGGFSEAFAFMTRVALLAEKLDHHPDWSNSWNRVTIDIVSHAEGGLTDTCFRLAEGINALTLD